ncbi:MAG: hypothetical protein GDA44_02350 [Prochloron sp. SP5CPC1]|nr:hypothetical protein [Candidatus Paraprochloron terpiosi SP5CPC1]
MVVLVQAITRVLVPYLPFLLPLGQKTGEKEAETLAHKLWAKLKPAVEVKPAALEAAEDVAKSPEDEDAIASLRQQLKKILTARENAALRAEVTEILASFKSKSDVNGVEQTMNRVMGFTQGVTVAYQGGLVNAAKGWSGSELAEELDKIVQERR